MKRYTKWLLVLAMTALLIACGAEEPSETTMMEETTMETNESIETTPETVAETEAVAEAIAIDTRFPKAKPAKTIYRMSSPSGFADKLAIASLQGLAAKHSDEQIFLSAGAMDFYVPYIEENWGCEVTTSLNGKTLNIQNLAEHYKPFLKGYILSSMNEDSESADVAISLAGVLDCVIATKSNHKMFENMGLECVLDVTEWTDADLRASEYWSLIRTDIAFEQPNSMAPRLADYAILCGAYFNFYDGRNMNEHKAMYEFLDDNAVVFGYNNTLGEFDTVKSFSELNIQMIPSDHASNISTLSGFPLETMTQKRAEVSTETPEQVHTVCFLMSDGDNMQWIVNDFSTTDRWYGSPLRGSFDIGWGLPPASIDLIAPMATYLYDTMTERDEFIMELSGIGYTFPSKWEKEQRQTMAAELATFMKRSDLKYAEILDDNGFKMDVVEDFTAQDGIDGLFYIEYSHYAARNGKILWTNGKPAVAARYRLWGNQSDSSIETLAKRINKASTDPTDEKAYSFVIVHAWSGMKDGKLGDGGSTMEAVAALIEQFGEQVEVVAPTEFMTRLVNNVPHEE